MKLENIRISGYKSIDELEFPIKKYGKSYTAILLGKNEAGKSNVLDAMTVPILEFEEEKVNFLDIENQQRQPEKIEVEFLFNFKDEYVYRDEIDLDEFIIPEDLLIAFNITKFSKKFWITREYDSYKYSFDFDYKKIPITTMKKYSFAKIQETIPAIPAQNGVAAKPEKMVEKWKIVLNTELDDEDREIYVQLSDETFKNFMEHALEDFAYNLEIPIDKWEANEKYLIQGKIDLSGFAENPSKNIPLKHMFFLAGYETKEQIVNVVSDLESDGRQRNKLKKKLSRETTEYLNKKWPEHKIEIDVNIESDLSLEVHVKDKNDEDSYFNMTDRSQGFRQFISLLLSISISSVSEEIKDHLILIDEPEVHMHPSGVRYMLKELLEIGRNNYVFLSTHSNFMLDKNVKERHFLLEKDKNNLTTCHQIKTDEDVNDDEILQAAFGINVIADFLPAHKILVEGQTDKTLIGKALSLYKNSDIVISKGNGSNLESLASMMASYGVIPLVITDADESGRKVINKITKNDKEFCDKVFTIRDLNGNIVPDGTIEDTLPSEFIQKKANEIFVKNEIEEIFLTKDKAFFEQINIHMNKELSGIPKKERSDKITKISGEIKIVISDFPKNEIKEKAPILYELARKILDKFEIKT